jgi:hypothetical protein
MPYTLIYQQTSLIGADYHSERKEREAELALSTGL